MVEITKTKDQATQDEKDRNNDADDRRWTRILAIATLIVGVLSLFVYIYQAGKLRDTIAKMDEIAKGQAADIAKSIAESARAATAMEASAEAAKLSATVAATTATFLDRPWLSVKVNILTDPVHVTKTGLSLRARFTVTNAGRSAAQHVFLVAQMIPDEDAVRPMDEVTRLMNSIPKDSIGHVVLPSGELVREFDFTVPVSDIATTRPTIFGGVRYTHGRGTGIAIPSVFHSTTFGFKIVPADDVARHFPATTDTPEAWHWMPRPITSARDFSYAD